MIDLFTKSGAVLSDDGLFRYRLWRIWNDTLPKVLIIGLNPSTADAFEDDRTINRCRNFATSWGFGGLYMGNLWAYRATKPKDLKQAIDARFNMNRLENLMALIEMKDHCDKVVFAWGANKMVSYKEADKEMIDEFPNSFCIRKTKHGFPEHPLYLKGELPLINF